MARKKAAQKALRVTKRRTARNILVKKQVRDSIRKVHKAIAAGKPDEAKSAYKEVSSRMDRAVKNGILHKRSVARYKSRLSSAIKKASAKK